PTPTAAAEMAVPVREELWVAVKQMDGRLAAAIQMVFARRLELLAGLARGLPRPGQLLDTAAQRLDDWSERLLAALPAHLSRKEQQLVVAASALRPQVLINDIRKLSDRVGELLARLQAASIRVIQQREDRMSHLSALLE